VRQKSCPHNFNYLYRFFGKNGPATVEEKSKERKKKMAKIAIKDLEKSQELDKEAMKNLRGGWWWSQSSSMGFWSTPWGGRGL
jgi:natural product precursor